jgi:hypothetical protein
VVERAEVLHRELLLESGSGTLEKLQARGGEDDVLECYLQDPLWACVSMCVLGPCAPVQVRVWVGTPLAPALGSPPWCSCAPALGGLPPLYMYTSTHQYNHPIPQQSFSTNMVIRS